MPHRHLPPGTASIHRLYRDGVAAFDRGEFEEAAGLLSQVCEHPGVPGTLARYYLSEARITAGLTHIGKGQFGQAIVQLHAACRLNPSADNLCDFLARCYARHGELDKAVDI